MATKNPTILLCTPFKNDDHAIPTYVKSLLNLDYPKELIDVVWLESDSADQTWPLLQKHHKQIISSHRYHSFRLIQKSYGFKFPKNPPGSYYRDVHPGMHGDNKLWKRNAENIIAFHNFFFSLLKDQDYFMLHLVDAVSPPNSIRKYLHIFNIKHDAAWVGGINHRRFPRHKAIGCPWSRNYKIVSEANLPKTVFECGFTCHVFLIKREVIKKGARPSFNWSEIYIPFSKAIRRMGYKCYCDPTVYIKHVSTDGKIHRHSL